MITTRAPDGANKKCMIIYSAYTCIDGGIVLEDCICIVLCFKPFECIGLSTWAGLYIGGWRCLAEPSDHELWISQLITVYTILCTMLLCALYNDIRCYTMLHNGTLCCYTMLPNWSVITDSITDGSFLLRPSSHTLWISHWRDVSQMKSVQIRLVIFTCLKIKWK